MVWMAGHGQKGLEELGYIPRARWGTGGSQFRSWRLDTRHARRWALRGEDGSARSLRGCSVGLERQGTRQSHTQREKPD
jgi:hypothetical protein